VLIINNCQLKQFYQECQNNKTIAIDTEFYWTKTYKAIPCLIQIANSEREIIIDLITHKLDLIYLKKLLANQDIIKIFHSGRQDIEILYNLFNELPKNIFDTQIGVLPLSFKESSSLEKICKQLLAIKINKEKQVIDWRVRPLTGDQINYAKNDVKYLILLYKKIIQKLNYIGRIEWIKELHEKLICINKYINKETQAWKKVKFKPKYTHELNILKRLSELRERYALEKNIPPKRIFNDSKLIKFCKLQNKKEIKSSIATLDRKISNLIFKVIDEEITDGNKEIKIFKMSNNQILKLKLAKELLKVKSKELNIESSLIANKQELEDLVLKKNDELLSGWKYEVFGKDYEKIKL
tara:strand:+ start:449 stop:1507 length:1059 start_codon:yes stop_codon:yes gene_type:complete